MSYSNKNVSIKTINFIPEVQSKQHGIGFTTPFKFFTILVDIHFVIRLTARKEVNIRQHQVVSQYFTTLNIHNFVIRHPTMT